MKKEFDVIIVGGSYAGLSAAMALGRALRKVLIIDSGIPCNRQTPHSHNFITHDGESPSVISLKAKTQVSQYPTITFVDGKVISGKKLEGKFQVDTDDDEQFFGRKLLFTTGMKDLMPPIDGFAECWGISVLHCPYCHGYEVKNEKTGIIANGNTGFELVKLIQHWTKDLKLLTNGPSELTEEQRLKMSSYGIEIIEDEIYRIEHSGGYVKSVHLKSGEAISMKAIYARPILLQHCSVPEQLGCEVTEQNLLKVDTLQRTTVPGIYAAGDNSTMMRSVAIAVASGGFAGAAINKEMIDEHF